MKVIDKLAWIQIKDRKVLSTRSLGKSVWYIPGGKREGAESDAEGLVREIREELSVEINAGSMQHFGNFTAQADGHDVGIMVKMQCYFADYCGALRASSEIEEFAWLSSIDKHRISPVDRLIFQELVVRDLID